MSLSTNQIISTSNSFLSEDFIDISTLDVIDMFFYNDTVHVFSRNDNGTISFGDYTKGVTSYTGSSVSVSDKDKFPITKDIFIITNVYNENEYFLFYNVDDTIKFRTFNNQQGYFSNEKTLSEDYTIKQSKQVYENNIFILEVNSTGEIFKFIKDLPNKEMKVGFLFTSEIEKWNKNNIHPSLQVIETPFNNINEIAYSVDNLVGNDIGFIYMSGNKLTEEYDEKSINGNIIKNFDEIFVKMAGEENYTLNIRAQLSTVTEETLFLKTNNYEIKYNGSLMTLSVDTDRITDVFADDASEPCIKTEKETDNQLPLQEVSVDISISDYSLLFITNTYYNRVNVITVYIGDKVLQIERDINELNIDYYPDTYMNLKSIFKIDYMSQQKYALSATQITNLQNVFTNGANSEVLHINKVFSYSQIKRHLYGLDTQMVIDHPYNYTIQNVEVLDSLDSPVAFELNQVAMDIQDIKGVGEFRINRINNVPPIKGKLVVSYDLVPRVHSIEYTKNHKLNSSYQYTFGKYLPIDKDIDISLLRGTVVPYKIKNETGIPRVIYSDPKKQIRVANSTSQIFDRVPFIIEDKYEAGDYIIWISLDNFNDNGIPVQYGLIDEDVIDTHTYSKYETLSSKTYNPSDYYFAYHFNNVVNNNKILIKNLFIEDAGELFLVGNSNANDYIREIREIRFMDIPKKYKTNFFKVKIDTENKNKKSFINSNKEIQRIARTVIDEWKPSHTNLIDIEESNAIIMSKLLSDEFAQVLVGFTPNSNVNSYYVRSIESGELDIFTSSGRFDESIDWLAVGRMDSPYVKAGVTKVNTPAKQFKIFFESKFDNSDYRIFVFSPTNSKYYVPAKDQEGFIVESSYLVEDEVSWIAVNSNQVINGTLNWKSGIPEDEKRVSNLDRVTEIGLSSHKYTLNFADLGFENFDSDDYSVILSSDSNINLWYTDKKLNSVDIRRSYTGEDMSISYMIIKGNTKWFDNISG